MKYDTDQPLPSRSVASWRQFDSRDFLDLAAARASGELKGTVSYRKVNSDPVMSTRSGLEVVVLMSAEIVAGGESLACFPGRSANIFVDCRFLRNQSI